MAFRACEGARITRDQVQVLSREGLQERLEVAVQKVRVPQHEVLMHDPFEKMFMFCL